MVSQCRMLLPVAEEGSFRPLHDQDDEETYVEIPDVGDQPGKNGTWRNLSWYPFFVISHPSVFMIIYQFHVCVSIPTLRSFETNFFLSIKLEVFCVQHVLCIQCSLARVMCHVSSLGAFCCRKQHLEMSMATRRSRTGQTRAGGINLLYLSEVSTGGTERTACVHSGWCSRVTEICIVSHTFIKIQIHRVWGFYHTRKSIVKVLDGGQFREWSSGHVLKPDTGCLLVVPAPDTMYFSSLSALPKSSPPIPYLHLLGGLLSCWPGIKHFPLSSSPRVLILYLDIGVLRLVWGQWG